MSEDRGRTLANHFGVLWQHPIHPVGFAERIARSILDDPQAHVDALVVAGVLEPYGRGGHCAGERRGFMYLLPDPEPPHVHEWHAHETSVITATGTATPALGVTWRCDGCSETGYTTVWSTLPPEPVRPS